MTNVKIRRVPIAAYPQTEHSDLCDELQLIVEGHAGYGERGRDLVCSAESILVQCFAAFLAGLAQDDLADFTVDGVEQGGSVAIAAIPTQKGWHTVCGAFQCIAMGFFLLAKHYPNYVTVQINEPSQEDSSYER